MIIRLEISARGKENKPPASGHLKKIGHCNKKSILIFYLFIILWKDWYLTREILNFTISILETKTKARIDRHRGFEYYLISPVIMPQVEVSGKAAGIGLDNSSFHHLMRIFGWAGFLIVGNDIKSRSGQSNLVQLDRLRTLIGHHSDSILDTNWLVLGSEKGSSQDWHSQETRPPDIEMTLGTTR